MKRYPPAEAQRLQDAHISGFMAGRPHGCDGIEYNAALARARLAFPAEEEIPTGMNTAQINTIEVSVSGAHTRITSLQTDFNTRINALDKRLRELETFDSFASLSSPPTRGAWQVHYYNRERKRWYVGEGETSEEAKSRMYAEIATK